MQFDMLVQAEREVQKQIAELALKKQEQVARIAQSICTDAHIKELDKKIHALQARREAKTHELLAVRQELGDLEADAERKSQLTRQEVPQSSSLDRPSARSP